MSLDLFVSPDDTLTIKFVVAPDKTDPKTLYAETSLDSLKEFYGDVADLTLAEEHSAVFRRPNFNDMSVLYDQALSWSGTEVKANASSIRMNKMIRLIKSWTLPRPSTADEVRNLVPSIALILGAELDRLAS